VISGSGTVREGRVVRRLGDLEERGRVARLLVEVDDPLGLLPESGGRQPLLIGEYVRAEISGHRMEKIYSIPRYALREDSAVWIAGTDGTLDIRSVDVLWRDTREVIVRDGLRDGELLIVSDLTAPLHGMDINPGGKKGNPPDAQDKQGTAEPAPAE
jgi:hypothetical protein